MDVKHEILEVCVYTCLIVNRCLFICKKVVELHNSNCNCLILLSLHHFMLEDGVFDDLESYNGGELSSLSDIPPVVTVQGGIQIVSQTLKESQNQ